MAPMEVWAHPDDHQSIRKYAATLAKSRDQAANAAHNLPPRANAGEDRDGMPGGQVDADVSRDGRPSYLT
jgi:hypothetical protein